jgi:hypothetical protein
MRFIDSMGPEYAALTAYVSRRSPSRLLEHVDPPSARRYAAIVGSVHEPRSVAIVSAYDTLDLVAPSMTLGLCIIESNGERFSGTLGDLAGGEPFLHLELFESFDRRRGYARELVGALEGVNLIVSPIPDSVRAYERLGFSKTELYDSAFTRPIMRRSA